MSYSDVRILNSSLSHSWFSLNSVEKDLNRHMPSHSTMIGCRFRVSFGNAASLWHLVDDEAVDLDVVYGNRCD